MVAHIRNEPALSLLYSVPRDYRGEFRPLIAEPRTYAEVIEIRAAPRVVLVLIREGNHLHLIEATHCDEPGLEVLSPHDRARVASAVHALHRDSGEGAANGII